jgi:hypothetical protein
VLVWTTSLLRRVQIECSVRKGFFDDGDDDDDGTCYTAYIVAI